MGTLKPVSSNPITFRTAEDFDMVTRLLRDSSLYKIPPKLREIVVVQAAQVLQDIDSDSSEKLAASRLILEMDKRNLDLVKMIVPKKVEHFNAQQATDEELVAIVKEAHDILVKE